MALPNSVDSGTPAGTDSPSLGDDQIRDFKTFLEDIFSIPNNTAIAAAGLDFVAAGLQTIIFQDAAANPATAGYFQRNATNLLFYDGTAARTVAFLERNQTFDPGSQSGTTSVQAVAGDLTLAAGYGSSTATSPVYAAGVMGNVISTANMTATQNIIAGVIGKYDLTGTNASVLAKAGVIGEVGDNGDTANAAVMALLGGDTAATNPAAAFGVMSLNSTPASNFGIGLDLYRAAVGSYQAISYGTAATRVPNASWHVSRNAADSGNVNMIRVNASNEVELGSAVTVGSGGTGATSFTANGVLYGNTASAILVTAQGGTRTILTANAGAPAWSATPIINTSVQIGVVSSTTGSLSLANSASALLTTLQAGNATEGNTLVLPVDSGTSGQVLQTDGLTPTTTLSWATASGGLTLAGSDTTERTTTATGDDNVLSTVTVSILAGTPFEVWVVLRKSAGAAAAATLGLQLNATLVRSTVGASAVTSSTDRAEDGLMVLKFGPRLTNYVNVGMAEVNTQISATGASAVDLHQQVGSGTNPFPIATITSVIITGKTGNALVTCAIQGVYVWTRTTS